MWRSPRRDRCSFTSMVSRLWAAPRSGLGFDLGQYASKFHVRYKLGQMSEESGIVYKTFTSPRCRSEVKIQRVSRGNHPSVALHVRTKLSHRRADETIQHH